MRCDAMRYDCGATRDLVTECLYYYDAFATGIFAQMSVIILDFVFLLLMEYSFYQHLENRSVCVCGARVCMHLKQ